MRRRLLFVVTVLALTGAACGPADGRGRSVSPPTGTTLAAALAAGEPR